MFLCSVYRTRFSTWLNQLIRLASRCRILCPGKPESVGSKATFGGERALAIYPSMVGQHVTRSKWTATCCSHITSLLQPHLYSCSQVTSLLQPHLYSCSQAVRSPHTPAVRSSLYCSHTCIAAVRSPLYCSHTCIAV